jgi:hypothetical protein
LVLRSWSVLGPLSALGPSSPVPDLGPRTWDGPSTKNQAPRTKAKRYLHRCSAGNTLRRAHVRPRRSD